MESNCIICMHDDRYEIAGPFPDIDALQAYGEKWQAENGDRPTWQGIYLAEPGAMPKVVAPR